MTGSAGEREKDMKKQIAILLLAALLLSLWGCAAQQPQPAAAPTETTAAPTETTAAPTETTPAPVPLRVGVMTGPTGIGMVKLMEDAAAEDTGVTFAVKGAADEMTPLLLQEELDIAAVPANLASVLYNKTQGGVQALAVNVLGVLSIGAYNMDAPQSFADLKGKTLYATGKGSVPEYFLRYLLTENGVDPDADVEILWKSEPAEVVALLNAEGKGLAMLPQPYVTAAGMQLGEGFRIALSLSDAWQALDNGSLCTTACILVRSAYAEEHPERVDAFLSDYAASAKWVNENVAEAAELCGKYEIVKAGVAKKAIPECNIVCITGAEMKAALGGCLAVLHGQNPATVGGALPGDDFYYGA